MNYFLEANNNKIEMLQMDHMLINTAYFLELKKNKIIKKPFNKILKKFQKNNKVHVNTM